MITPYHSKYYAQELTRRFSSDKLEKLSQSLFNAVVDLNPHQIDAALFAFRSPLSRGAILADEVGLGKTIEAGLILSQLWAEKKRRIIIITPASLREQWSSELKDKFYIDSIILEAGGYNQFRKQNTHSPFIQSDKAVICSYHFAKAKGDEIALTPWDLVVIDEAHRLRNVYRKDNKIAKGILEAIGGRPKILLTATPLQNSLMELFGLVSFIDPHIFGSADSFRANYMRRAGEIGNIEFNDLRIRIQPICQRTLRRQVQEYIKYTDRIAITQDFTPSDAEVRLYEAVSTYLQREDAYALPSGQRALITLVLRKILASSSFAIERTLDTMINRLELMRQGAESDLAAALREDYDALSEEREEWTTDTEANGETSDETNSLAQRAEIIANAIESETNELKEYKNLAQSITSNAKGQALLQALKAGFEKASKLGAPQKALIFTESRRTQTYLKELLTSNGYAGSIVTLSGTNTDPDIAAVYKRWLQKHRGEDIVSGSKSVDIRTALVEEFRDSASIMIATETGAEGINLQFCSLVVNYDLPWNPQRIEQRIGRCHRYGQKHDVVVINFLNRANEADRRVFELLEHKFRLFSGVFGASDEVLGALESGVDFEKRVNDICQSCRTPEEINTAFDALQAELEGEIAAGLKEARAKLLEHFDEDVHNRLKVNKDAALTQLDSFSRWLWSLTKHELADYATFDEVNRGFELTRPPMVQGRQDIPLGQYRLGNQPEASGAHLYRLGHPLATFLLELAKGRDLPPAELVFDYSSIKSERKISLVEELMGKSGWLQVSLLQIEALEMEEELVFAGVMDDGQELDKETCSKLMMVPARENKPVDTPDGIISTLKGIVEREQGLILGDVGERNRKYFESEMDKLDVWAEDLKQGLERELKELDKEIREAKKLARQAATLEEKVEFHKKSKDLERTRNDKRRNLFEAQDDVDKKKEELLTAIEARLNQRMTLSQLFTIRWSVS